MAWSTRELDEPERRSNGYKKYGPQEPTRLVRIRHLVDLGVPLARIGEAGSDGAVGPEALRQVDAELAADIERLIRARSGIAAILRDSAPADGRQDDDRAGPADGVIG